MIIWGHGFWLLFGLDTGFGHFWAIWFGCFPWYSLYSKLDRVARLDRYRDFSGESMVIGGAMVYFYLLGLVFCIEYSRLARRAMNLNL